MKRLLCIVSSLNTGGAETFLMKLYRTFDTNKYQMDFVVNEPGVYDEEVTNRGGRIFSIPLRTQHPFSSFKALQLVIKRNNYRYVLKLCDTPIGITDLAAAKMGGATRVGVRSCNAGSNSSKAKEIAMEIIRPLFNRLCDYKIAPSKLAAEYTFGQKEASKNVYYVHNAINLKEYAFDEQQRQAIRKEFGINNEIVIGHVGRFSRQKNHEYLIKIFSEILKKRDDAVLMLVGDGELKDHIIDIVKENGIDNKIFFTGVRSDIPALLSAMDVFCFPSFYEGMPNTIIEAQANGLNCIISDTITRECNLTGLVDFLSLSSSPEYWADAITQKPGRYCHDDEIRYDFTQKGYNIEGVVKQFTSIVFGE